MENNFKNNTHFDKRIQESQKLSEKYPDRIPIIVEKLKKCELPIIDKSKYLVPKSMKVSQFFFVVRKRIKLDKNKALFITVNGSLLSANNTVGDIYENMKHNDGFLYMTYTGENTFG